MHTSILPTEQSSVFKCSLFIFVLYRRVSVFQSIFCIETDVRVPPVFIFLYWLPTVSGMVLVTVPDDIPFHQLVKNGILCDLEQNWAAHVSSVMEYVLEHSSNFPRQQ